MNRILVVDDEAGVRSFISEVLSDEGYEVSEAANGKEALQILGKVQHQLVVTDMKMPEMTGD